MHCKGAGSVAAESAVCGEDYLVIQSGTLAASLMREDSRAPGPCHCQTAFRTASGRLVPAVPRQLRVGGRRPTRLRRTELLAAAE